MLNQATLLDLHRETVKPDWIDYNGHMNVAYYVLVFDHGTDAFLDHIGLDETYRSETGSSVFVVESHVTYELEAHQGDRLRVTTQVLDADSKGLHIFHRMYRSDDAAVVATNELMILHVDLSSRRSQALPDTIVSRLRPLVEAHFALARPPQAGCVIGIRRSS